jgi:hypothetical protein
VKWRNRLMQTSLISSVLTIVVLIGSHFVMNSPDSNASPLSQLKTEFYSTDTAVSSRALRELVRLGKPATPILIKALTAPQAETKLLAIEGLQELRDPASADALEAATHDASGEVRARAAAALYRLNDRRALAALVRTLDDYPDVLHSPYTVSMYELLTGGKEVLPLVAPLLKAPQPATRERALLIIKTLVPKVSGGENWEQLWRSLGSYDPKGAELERNRAADQWQAWIQQRS